MNLSYSSRVIKYLMFIFNLIFVITGIIILAVGVSVKAYYFKYDTFLDEKYFSLPNLLIATGSIIFFISFFGCYGAIKENWLLLLIFSTLLVVIFIFEFSAGIAGYVLRDKTSAYLEDRLNRTLWSYNTNAEYRKMWDVIQEEFECCGVNNPLDYLPVFNSSNLPVSCCPQKFGTVGAFYCNSFEPAPLPSTVSNTTATTKPTESTTVTENTETTPTTTQTLPSTVTTDSSTATNTPTTTQTLPSIVTTDSSTATKTSTTTPTLSSTITTESSTTNITTAPAVPPQNPSNLPQPVASGPVARVKRDELATEPPQYSNSTSRPYPNGCEKAFGTFIKKHAKEIGGCAMGLAIVQLVGIIFSCHLARKLKNGYYST